MVECISMLTKFVNPEGRMNEADLSVEQVEKLKKTTGYTVLEKPKLRVHVSDTACFACE